jgi:hypothetical protein
MRAVHVACQRLHRQLLCDSSFAAQPLRTRSLCSVSAMDAFARILGPTPPAHGLLGEQQLLNVLLSAIAAVAQPVVDSRPVGTRLVAVTAWSPRYSLIRCSICFTHPPYWSPGFQYVCLLLKHRCALLPYVPKLQALPKHSLPPTCTQRCLPDAAAYR